MSRYFYILLFTRSALFCLFRIPIQYRYLPVIRDRYPMFLYIRPDPKFSFRYRISNPEFWSFRYRYRLSIFFSFFLTNLLSHIRSLLITVFSHDIVFSDTAESDPYGQLWFLGLWIWFRIFEISGSTILQGILSSSGPVAHWLKGGNRS